MGDTDRGTQVNKTHEAKSFLKINPCGDWPESYPALVVVTDIFLENVLFSA